MADADKKVIEKCRKLFEALRENQARGYAIAEEMGALLNGAEGIGDKLKRLEGSFSTLWQGRYGSAYVWAYVKDRPQMKRLIAHMDEADIEGRMCNYIRDADAYLVKARHSFGLFVSQINRYASAGQATTQDFDLEAPSDCKHAPICRSEQEHTRRRAEELRS